MPTYIRIYLTNYSIGLSIEHILRFSPVFLYHRAGLCLRVRLYNLEVTLATNAICPSVNNLNKHRTRSVRLTELPYPLGRLFAFSQNTYKLDSGTQLV